MTRLGELARVGLSSRRWLLPWIAVLLVPASLAYAMSSAIAGGTSASDQPAEVGTLAAGTLCSNQWWTDARGRRLVDCRGKSKARM